MEEATKLLPMVQKLHDDRLLGDGPRASWQHQFPFLNIWISYPLFDDFVLSSLSKANSVRLATDILRGAWFFDGSNSPGMPSPRLFEALIAMGADAHLNGPITRDGSMSPFVEMGTAFSNFLMHRLHFLRVGRNLPVTSLEAARSTVSMAVSMAMTCPDLSVTTPSAFILFRNGESVLQTSLPVLGDSVQTMTSALGNKLTCIVYEVDLKFLLLHLLSGLASRVNEDMESLGDSRLQELLPRLENPSAKIRLILNSTETDTLPFQEGWACHRLSPQLASTPEVCEITEEMFSGWKRGGFMLEGGSVQERLMRLTGDESGTEEVDLESAVLPFFNEGKGFCTLWQAGIRPPLRVIEEWERLGVNYPILFAQAKRELSDGLPENVDS